MEIHQTKDNQLSNKLHKTSLAINKLFMKNNKIHQHHMKCSQIKILKFKKMFLIKSVPIATRNSKVTMKMINFLYLKKNFKEIKKTPVMDPINKEIKDKMMIIRKYNRIRKK